MDEKDERGVKRKNDGDSEHGTNEKDERPQQVEETNLKTAVATPEKANDKEVKQEKAIDIIETMLAEHSERRFLTKWKELPPNGKYIYGGMIMNTCEYMATKKEFVRFLKRTFHIIFDSDDGDDDDMVANFVSDFYRECLHEGLIAKGEGDEFGNRVVAITHGLNQEFLGTFDLQELHKHILTVLKWYDEDHKQYRSPSFALVQSSGMGKTKLMHEYARQHNNNSSSDIECRLILCTGRMEEDPPKFEKFYHAQLELPEKGFNANDIKRQLIKIERTCKKDKIVFFFDEAQKLLSEKSTGAYETVIWWLRESRMREYQYVGVFSGTLLELSNHVRTIPSRGYSRDPEQSYMNYDPEERNTEDKLLLYDPFYTLTTVSLPHSCNNEDDICDELKDIRKHGSNGRPLFAAMLRRQGPGLAPALTLSDKNFSDGVITDCTIYNILYRVLLSPEKHDCWASSDGSIASVLGTRVQLGLANYDFVNKAISCGYAMLIKYDIPKPKPGPQDQLKKFGSVAIVFPPDPVCAALAMGMMQAGWRLKNTTSIICGKEPKFWVKNLARLLDQYFFFPCQGDSGEMFAALYMLLCGDVLRYSQDPYMRLFEVDLKAWVGEVKQKLPAKEEGTPQYHKATPLATGSESRAKQLCLQHKSNDKAQQTTGLDMEGKTMVLARRSTMD